MAKTLLNFVADELTRGCVMSIQDNSVLMGLLPFKTTGGSMTHIYNVVDEYTASEFRNINEGVNGSFVEPEQVVETLKILSGDVKVDRIFLTGGVGNINDIKSEQTLIAMKSMANKLETQFLYGTGTGKDFKGLKPRIADGIGKSFTGALSMDILDECIDYISYGAGTKVIICNPKSKRALNKLMRASNTATTTVEMFGQSVIKYDGVVIYTSEAVADDEIFFINLDEAIGVTGLTTNGLHASEQGYENNFYRTAVEMIVGLKTAHPRCFCILNTTVSRAKSK